MTSVQAANRELGSDSEFAALIERVQGFDFDNATHTDQMNLIRALKVLAKDIVDRHANVKELESKLKERASLVEVTNEIGALLAVLDPKPRNRWIKWTRR